MRIGTPIAALLALCAMARGAAGAEALPPFRAHLERARELQGKGARALEGLLAGQERPGSLGDLRASLESVHRLQAALVRSCRSLVARTFGRTAGTIAEEDRKALERLASEGSAAREGFARWRDSLERAAAGPETPDSLRAFQERAAGSPIPERMEEALQAAAGLRLSDAAARGLEAADGIIRLILSLEEVGMGPEDLLDRRRQALDDLAAQGKRLRSGLDGPSPPREELRRTARELSDLAESLRGLTFDEAGLPAGALEEVRGAAKLLEEAQSLLRKEDLPGAAQALDGMLAALAKAAGALRPEGAAAAGPMVRVPPPRRGADRPVGTAVTPGGPGGGGADTGPLAELAADLAVLERIREGQARLRLELSGKATGGSDPLDRQVALGDATTQLLHRVEVYHPQAAKTLQEAGIAMGEAAGRLVSGSIPEALARGQAALDRLEEAAVLLQAFRDELLEALARISRPVDSGPPQGAAGAGAESASKLPLLDLLREMVRLGRLMKEEDGLIRMTAAWADAPPPEGDPGAAAAAKEQGRLAAGAAEIGRGLEPSASLAAGLVEAVQEAALFLDGAAQSLEKGQFEKALDRQRTAMEFLANAWSVVSGSAAASGRAGRIASEGAQGLPGAEGSGAAASAAPGGGEPWYLGLPPREREAVRQSLEARLPAGHEEAVRRYYERLAARRKGKP